MNILELCLSDGLGGLELYVFRTSESLANNVKNKNNVTAVVRPNSKLDKYYKENLSINIKHIKPFFTHIPLFNARKLATIIDRNNTDILHIHWGKDLPLAAIAKTLSKRKPSLIYTRHMMITRSKDDIYHNFLYSKVDLLLTITKELENLCLNFIPSIKEKIVTLYHGVKTPDKILNNHEREQQRKTLGFSKQDFVIGIIGRIEKEKGQHLLIKALHIAANNNQIFKAIIVGREMQTGYKKQLQEQAKKSGVLNNISFQEFNNDPQLLMQLCDCIVLATNKETFGLVLPEAMRSQVAVIGSDSGGVTEIIDHDRTGLLFETGNAKDLYHQLERLYLDPHLKDKLALQGKNEAEQRFNNDSHFKKLEEHLTSALHN